MASQPSPSNLEVFHFIPRPDELNMTQSPDQNNVTMVPGGVTSNEVTTTMKGTTHFTEAPVELERCLWILYAEFGPSKYVFNKVSAVNLTNTIKIKNIWWKIYV